MSGGGVMVTGVEVEHVLGSYPDGYVTRYYYTGDHWARLTYPDGRQEVFFGRDPLEGGETVFETHDPRKHGDPPRKWRERLLSCPR